MQFFQIYWLYSSPNSLGETVVVGRLVEETDCGIVPLKLTTLTLAPPAIAAFFFVDRRFLNHGFNRGTPFR